MWLRAGPAPFCPPPLVLSCLRGTVLQQLWQWFLLPYWGFCLFSYFLALPQAPNRLCLMRELRAGEGVGGGRYKCRGHSSLFYKNWPGILAFSASCRIRQSPSSGLFLPAVFLQRKIFWFCRITSVQSYLECGGKRELVPNCWVAASPAGVKASSFQVPAWHLHH